MKYFAMLFSVVTAAAFAADATNIDMTKKLVFDGKPIPDTYYVSKDDPDCAHCQQLTLGHAAAHALLALYPDERDLDAEQKWARGVLAARIKDEPKAELTVEEVSLIKRLIGKLYTAPVVSQVFPLLDPNAKPPAVHG